ncbi:hypothetical protein ADEAN_000421100 [Angomonas deanei]|uniref:Uncharacterized protein n=1 Tax=Angomonas deanei TaxID=59799 RepID=A0A7G2CAE5_9TRYP|nr:hypothetical protein ADEAN_000421100 [Angomonas deanei]
MEKMGYTLSRNTSVTLSSLLLKAGKLELAQTVLKWKGINPSEKLPENVDSDVELEEEDLGEQLKQEKKKHAASDDMDDDDDEDIIDTK